METISCFRIILGLENALDIDGGMFSSAQKPASMALYGCVVYNLGRNNYQSPDWYFFDVINAKNGSVVTLSTRQGDLQGLVFDSTPTTYGGTAIMIK